MLVIKISKNSKEEFLASRLITLSISSQGLWHIIKTIPRAIKVIVVAVIRVGQTIRSFTPKRCPTTVHKLGYLTLMVDVN